MTEEGLKTVLEGRRDGRLQWRSPPSGLLRVSPARFGDDGEELLFALEMHYSDLDGEIAPRPYVYRVAEGGLLPLWRGSALAWPLLDADVILGEGGRCFLCALHRGDSFLVPDPEARGTRTAAYVWNGFGFSGDGIDNIMESECEKRLDEK